MKIFAIATVALGLSVAASATASASDLYLPEQPMTPVYDDGAFPWEGLYFGVTKGIWYSGGENYFEVSKVVGFNFLVGDNVLIGAEGSASWLVWPTQYFDFRASARLGILLDDSVLLYKRIGIGMVDNDQYWFLGGGVEVAVGESVSLRAAVDAVTFDGSGVDYWRPSVGLIWHFN